MKFHLPFALSCEEFRLRTGAEPRVIGWSQRLHRWMCIKCRLFAKDVRCIDRDLFTAFRVDLDGVGGGPHPSGHDEAQAAPDDRAQ